MYVKVVPLHLIASAVVSDLSLMFGASPHLPNVLVPL